MVILFIYLSIYFPRCQRYSWNLIRIKKRLAASENREAAAMKCWRRNQPQGVDPMSGTGRTRRG